MNNITLAARANIFKAVSILFLPPDDNIFEVIAFLEEAAAKALPEAEGEVRAMKNMLYDKNFNLIELRKDFSRLFVGPEKLIAPPYGSVYLDGKRQLMQNSTLEALNFYIQAGLCIHENYDQPPDFISAEFEFAYFLTFKLIETGSVDYANRLNEFLATHPGRWVSDFGALVEAGAEFTFYPALTRIAIKIAQKKVVGYAAKNCAKSS